MLLTQGTNSPDAWDFFKLRPIMFQLDARAEARVNFGEFRQKSQANYGIF